MRLLVLGHNDWWVWQQQGFAARTAAMVQELAKRAQVELVAVVDTPRWRGRTHRPVEARGDQVTPVAESVVAVRWSYPIPLPGNRLRARRLNEALSLARSAHRVAAALPSDGPVIALVADPRLVGVALRLPHDLLVVDVIDDWRSHPWAGRAAVEDGYRLAGLHADVVVGVCEQALNQVGLGDRGRILFNAIDPELWRTARQMQKSAGALAPTGRGLRRRGAGALRRPSAVAPWRGACRRSTSSSPAHSCTACRPIWRALPPTSILWGPSIDERLPGWLLAMDACIMPHRRDGLTASMDPLKLYEYLAAGRPVVSTIQSPNPALQAHVRVVRDCGRVRSGVGGRAEQRLSRATEAPPHSGRRARVAAARRPSADDDR